jgi:lipopolysaccharide transport system permease protein
MIDSIRELIARRELVYLLAWREIKVRYKQSVMGLLWAVFMPLVIVCAGIVVRYAFARESGAPLALSDITPVAVKAAPWAFFVATLRFGTNSLVSNSTLVTKVYMPRLAFPISAVCGQLFDLAIAGSVIVVLLLIARTGISIQLLWVPALIGCLVLLATGIVVITSAASLFFRDIKYLVDVVLTFAIFFTPVFYESSLFGDWAPLILLNPLAPLFEGLSQTVIKHHSPSLPWLAYSFVFSALLCTASLAMFSKLEPLFAESV